jgi:hypothetical protein
MTAYEKPRKGNPNRLTIDQHVFPSASIARFADANGGISVYDMLRKKTRITHCNDVIFCARRAWDHRAEAGYMKQIEDEFQPLATKIIDGDITEIGAAERGIVNRFYGLWYYRARHRKLASQELVTGDSLTKEQEENFEAHGAIFTRAGGKIPARMMNGIQLQMKINRIVLSSIHDAQWGIIRADAGEFIVPDRPYHTVVPLTPTLCLMAPGPNGTITKDNVTRINRDVRATCQTYYFARDFALCSL